MATIRGNNADNTLTGTPNNDSIFGFGGNDLLDGGLGKDRMEGGLGDNSYHVDNPGDRVIEPADVDFSFSTDTVLSTVSYTLPDNVENLTLTGTWGAFKQTIRKSHRLVGNPIIRNAFRRIPTSRSQPVGSG